MNQLKSNEDVGYVSLLTAIAFDDLYDNFKFDRFSTQQTPIHSLNIFPRADVKANVKGAFLARC